MPAVQAARNDGDMGATIAPVTGVTGATGGIGRCFIEQLLREPDGEIWAVARAAQRRPPLCTEPSPSIAPIPPTYLAPPRSPPRGSACRLSRRW